MDCAFIYISSGRYGVWELLINAVSTNSTWRDAVWKIRILQMPCVDLNCIQQYLLLRTWYRCSEAKQRVTVPGTCVFDWCQHCRNNNFADSGDNDISIYKRCYDGLRNSM